jgi:electron transfer flavoprotein beta subunit
MPSLKNKMRAKKAEIPSWGIAELGLDADEVGLAGSYTQVVRVFSPPRRSDRVVIEGSPEEQAEALYRHLKEAGVPNL